MSPVARAQENSNDSQRWRLSDGSNRPPDSPVPRVLSYALLNGGTELPRHAITHADRYQFENFIALGFIDWKPGDTGISRNLEAASTTANTDGERNPFIEKQLHWLFASARDEQFETGMDSLFSAGLQRLNDQHPFTVLRLLKSRLTTLNENPEVLAEMLRWAAHQEALVLRHSVLALLVEGLYHTSSLVRDAAALGLAWLGGDEVVVPLQRAVERETVPELKDDLEELIR